MSTARMTDADVTTPDHPPSGGATGPGRGRGAALVLAVSAAVVFAVLAVVLAVLLAGDDGGDDTAELRQAAGRFAEALVTYDYRDPDAHRDTVLGFATGSFREEYEQAFDEGLARVITEVEAVSQGYVNDVYVSEIDEERASAVVSVDIEHDGAGGQRTLRDIYFRLAFVHADGEWKVDQVTDLSFPTTPGGPVLPEPGGVEGEDGSDADSGGEGAAGEDPGVTAGTAGSTSTSLP